MKSNLHRRRLGRRVVTISMAWRAETPCGAFGIGHCGWNGKLAAIRYRFQCREWSAATGLVNFRMRWYDSVTGRWLSKDPIGLNGGLNLYAFCNGDPVNYLDADGTLLVPFLMNSLVAAGIAAIAAVAMPVLYSCAEAIVKTVSSALDKAVKAVEEVAHSVMEMGRGALHRPSNNPFGDRR